MHACFWLQVRRVASLGPDDMSQKMSSSAREYVLSLHQNYRSTLLYGKNGVTVEPVCDFVCYSLETTLSLALSTGALSLLNNHGDQGLRP